MRYRPAPFSRHVLTAMRMIGTHFWHWLTAGGRPEGARLSRWGAQAAEILALADRRRDWSDEDVTRAARSLRWRAQAGEPLERLVDETYALAIEAARRTRGWRHYPVQIMGGLALFEGGVAEMQTGEGKTLTAVLPTALRALPGRACHVVTVNDYLAERDAELMRPIYQLLGLSVGRVLSTDKPDVRREAYDADITYATAKELGFDFLRDRLRRSDEMPPAEIGKLSAEERAAGMVQRPGSFALLDEADSILIDEARTPLIIALAQPIDPGTRQLYRWCDRAARDLTLGVDFVYDPRRKSAGLTAAGCRRIALSGKPPLLDAHDAERIYKQVEMSLTAQTGFALDRDYIVDERREVVIVDESTGRLMHGRRWQEGLHQAVEAREQVPITAATGQAARITVQTFFRRYPALAGMTGTASTVRAELWRTFRLRVTQIPTHRPSRRELLPTQLFRTHVEKTAAILESVRVLRSAGRAVLIGTPSVERSERLGQALAAADVPHTILNARKQAEEAEIVAAAGQPGRVTIATNMAGRGTDIHLDPAVAAAGGLHVIVTEMHSSTRIDRQLIGRCGRQGDPGSFQLFLSLEDEIFLGLEPKERTRLRRLAGPGTGPLSPAWFRTFWLIQQRVERLHARQRRELLKHEQSRADGYRRMGLDPFLEMTEN